VKIKAVGFPVYMLKKWLESLSWGVFDVVGGLVSLVVDLYRDDGYDMGTAKF